MLKEGDHLNPVETGKAIAFLRREAGLTQAALAEALEVSDKAVSKWERGLACPDISLLPKLSILLDTDIENFFSGEVFGKNERWNGILLLDELSNHIVYTKPLVHLLLQNFMLVGIKDILIIGGKAEQILGSGKEYGLNLNYSYDELSKSLLANKKLLYSGTMIIYGNILIYGAHITRKYQALMHCNDEAISIKTYGGKILPVLFCPSLKWKNVLHRISGWQNIQAMKTDLTPIEKPLARGVVCLPMNNEDQILNAAQFIQLCEKNDGKEMFNLYDIAKSRGLL